VFHAIWHIKNCLFGPGGVENPRDTTLYRCSLRLARTKNPSFLFVPPSVKHCTGSLSDLKEIGCKFAWPVHISPLFGQ
jgi:hypothetical protein